MTTPDWVTDELCQCCFDLAWFCFPEKQEALEIVKRALAKLDVTLVLQDKRRKHEGKHRNKIVLADLAIVQRLILMEADVEASGQESRGGDVAVEDMIVRWCAFLIRHAYDNSFQATVAQCRIAHNYSTADAHTVYGFVLQDPSRDKDDDKYRRVKGRLHERIGARFRGRVQTIKGLRGEDRFKPAADQTKYEALVDDALKRFAPWGAKTVVVPDDHDPTQDIFQQLHFVGGHPDDEAEVEGSRIWSILHPQPFASITRSLHLAMPRDSRSIPEFQMINGTDDMSPTGDRSEAPKLSSKEQGSVKAFLREQARDRWTSTVESLIITVDGVERWRQEVTDSLIRRFHFDTRDELVEVHGLCKGKTIGLGALILVRDADDCLRPGSYAVQLEEGYSLSLELPAEEEGSIIVRYAPAAQTGWNWRDSLLPNMLPAMAHRVRIVGTVDADPAAVTKICPQCGGQLTLHVTEEDGTSVLRIWKCDRCPHISIDHPQSSKMKE